MVDKLLSTRVGTVLCELREAKNLSQEKFANLCDLDRSYISRIERGLQSPSVKNLFVICEVLEIKPSEFLKRVELS